MMTLWFETHFADKRETESKNDKVVIIRIIKHYSPPPAINDGEGTNYSYKV